MYALVSKCDNCSFMYTLCPSSPLHPFSPLLSGHPQKKRSWCGGHLLLLLWVMLITARPPFWTASETAVWCNQNMGVSHNTLVHSQVSCALLPNHYYYYYHCLIVLGYLILVCLNTPIESYNTQMDFYTLS